MQPVGSRICVHGVALVVVDVFSKQYAEHPTFWTYSMQFINVM